MTQSCNSLKRLWCQDNIVFQIQLGFGVSFFRLEINNQVILHGEHGICLEVLVVVGEYLGCDGLVFGVGDLEVLLVDVWLMVKNGAHHEMDVSRSHWVPVQQLQQRTSKSISWQRVCGWLQAVEVVLSVLVASEFSSQVVVDLVLWVLEIVLSVRRCLPNIEDSSRDALSGQKICDFAVHQSWVSAQCWVLDDAPAEFAERGVG